MKNRTLYASEGTTHVELSNIEAVNFGDVIPDLNVDWSNHTNIQSYRDNKSEDLIIVDMEAINDTLLNHVKWADVNIKSITTTEWGNCEVKNNNYGKMKLQFIMSVTIRGVLTHYVCFTNYEVKTSILKKEINNIIDRQCRDMENERLCNSLDFASEKTILMGEDMRKPLKGSSEKEIKKRYL